MYSNLKMKFVSNKRREKPVQEMPISVLSPYSKSLFDAMFRKWEK